MLGASVNNGTGQSYGPVWQHPAQVNWQVLSGLVISHAL